MKQRQIIFRFLFPTYQYAAKAIHPAMGSLYNPATSFETSLVLNRLCFFATRTNMSSIAKFFHQVSYLSGIITFIKTHTLFFPFRRLRSFHWNTFYRSLCHFAVMPISAINRKADRYSKTFGKQTAFNALFCSVCRVWAGFSPHPAGLLSWRRPSIAMTSQYPSTHRNLPEPSSTVLKKRRLLPIPEIGNETYCLSKYQSHLRHSIDNQFAIRKKSRSLLCDPALSVCRRQSDACLDVLELAARFFSIIHLKYCIYFLFFLFSSLNPFKGIIAFDYIGNSGVIRIGS
jgi:hypothetical protein